MIFFLALYQLLRYNGALFYADYARKYIKYLLFDGNGKVIGTQNQYTSSQGNAFETSAGSVISFEPGPDGSLWYSTLTSLNRISYNGGVGPTSSTTIAPDMSCAARGCAYSGTSSCQCDGQCQGYGDCCSDYLAACVATTTAAPTTTTAAAAYMGPRNLTVTWAVVTTSVTVNAYVGDRITWVWGDDGKRHAIIS